MNGGMWRDPIVVRATLAAVLVIGLLAAPPHGAHGQAPGSIPRVGVIHISGHHRVVVDGLRHGLRELGLDEGKHVVLDVREIPGEFSKAAEEAARTLERSHVEVIYTVTSQITLAVKHATAQTPIVFYVGTDPVAAGLVESLSKPGGRLTGVHGLSRDVIAKRLALLKEMIPRLARIVTLYHPGESVSRENARVGRDAARQLGLQIVERHVRSVEEMRRALQALAPRDADAYFHTPGPLETSQALLVIEAAKAKRWPTMFHEQSLVAQGALASYGLDYHEIGRLSARHVQRILAGARAKDVPVENYDKVGFAFNLRTAREIGLKVPPSLLQRADRVTE